MVSHLDPDIFGPSSASFFQLSIYLLPVLPSLRRPLFPTVSVLEGGKGCAEETSFALVIHPCQPLAAGSNYHLLRSDLWGVLAEKLRTLERTQTGFSSACNMAKFEHSFRELVQCVFLTESCLLPNFTHNGSKH